MSKLANHDQVLAESLEILGDGLEETHATHGDAGHLYGASCLFLFPFLHVLVPLLAEVNDAQIYVQWEVSTIAQCANDKSTGSNFQ